MQKNSPQKNTPQKNTSQREAPQKNSLSFSRVHFIGIGGVGMSGIALVLHEHGVTVTGSDLKESKYVRILRNQNIDVRLGHKAATIDELQPEIVVVSTAIPETNPELMRARELGLGIWPRAKMLSALAKSKKTVAIAGTHGKTTTSSMVADMLGSLDLDPSFLIGGTVERFQTNGHDGKGDFYVAEADESDGSFLLLEPQIIVVTNIEADHLDHYGTLENIEKTFVAFMKSATDGGTVIVCGDTPRLLALAQEAVAEARTSGVHLTLITYGQHASNDFVMVPQKQKGKLESVGKIAVPSGEKLTVSLKGNPGLHNLLNATAVIAVASALELNLQDAACALSKFKGVRRRFTHIGDVAGTTVVDDYGHHPTEIAATLQAAAGLGFKRVVTVFQPHRYTRTQDFAAEFGTAFNAADVVRIMDVFSAGEMPIPGVSEKTIVNSIRKRGAVKDVDSIGGHAATIDTLCELCQEGDLLITMGAGDVTLVGPAFIEEKNARLKGKKSSYKV